MTAIAEDRNTPYMDGQIVPVPVKAATVIHAGLIVCADATGYAIEGKTADDLTYLGCAEQFIDNSKGADGDMFVLVRRLKAFQWANDSADPVLQAGLGKPCFIVDNQTVAATDGGATRSQAGIVVEIDADGVWVQ
ncbi:hypothetical protein PAN31117_04668 [Pandoraea anapnoica]|uniref:Uncharacterized protein n=1 Tax=Pandoraea anapnoica TaxID=2508301 RepID=A0A5E5AIH6_9BURK|nr:MULTISPECIES: hypothetical protein [Pandoraea]VVE14862.1 hypothetical protein PIN31009_02822 [Pandoraea iniqua]VVE73314.1 hypothetical protein PAN31117_04668 [Pandoraea anapnoica]